ncbi:MAG: HEAT repeat domain-containing protein [Dehalococcoidia bacterium]|jgi:HEAT repeat protein
MKASQEKANRAGGTRNARANAEPISRLIADLRTHDGHTREGARWALVALKGAAVAPLIDVLEDPDWHARWEAAKALGDIADPAAAPALVDALTDRRFGVRWLAAQGLIALGPDCLRPLLRALTRNTDSMWLRGGAHHILRDLSEGHLRRDMTEIVKPVLSALEGVEPSAQAPMAARAALDSLPQRRRRQRS